MKRIVSLLWVFQHVCFAHTKKQQLIIFAGWLLFCPFLVSFSYANCGSTERICKTQIKSLFYYTMYLDPTKTYTIQVDQVDGSVDPVIQVLSASTGSGMCIKDSGYLGDSETLVIGSSGNCSISAADYYVVIIHGYGGVDTGGQGRFGYRVDSDPVWYNQQTININGFVWEVNINAGEKIQTAPDTFNGHVDPVVILQGSHYLSLAINHNDDYGLLYRQSRVKNTGSNLINARVIVGSFSTSSEGTITLYRNDASDDEPKAPSWTTVNCNTADDADCDGIGNNLELALGSCPCVPSSPQCPVSNPPLGTSCKYYDPNNPSKLSPKDSDGDGLHDYWEIFGRPAFALNPNDGSTWLFSVCLSCFGVNIIHKDVLLEVDWMENSTKLLGVTIADIEKVLCRGSADNLRNPDGQLGIAIHIDGSGLTPSVGTCGSTWNDWGGSNSVITGLDAGNNMAKERTGIFRYAVIGADPVANLWRFNFESSNQSSAEERADIIYTFAHELGHTMGLSHGGTLDQQNWRPNYPSVMSYAGAFFMTDPSSTLPPIERVQYSKGVLLSLNPINVQENHGLGPNPINPDLTVYFFMDWVFNFPVFSNGSIDWNENGKTDTTSYKAFVDAPLCHQLLDCTRSLEEGQISTPLPDIHTTYRYAHLAVWNRGQIDETLYVFYPNASGNLTYRSYGIIYNPVTNIYELGWRIPTELKDSNNVAVSVTSPVSSQQFPVGCLQNSECGGGHLCSDGICAVSCSQNQDCEPGKTCQSGGCRTSCLQNLDCNPNNGESCLSSGYCGKKNPNRMYISYRDVNKKASLGYVYVNSSGNFEWVYEQSLTDRITPDGNGVDSSIEFNQGPSMIIDTRTSPHKLRIFYVAETNRNVYTRSRDANSSLSTESEVLLIVAGVTITFRSGVTPSAFIHPKEPNTLYFFSSDYQLTSLPNGAVLSKNINATLSGLSFSEIYHPLNSTDSLFNLYPNPSSGNPSRPNEMFFDKKVSFTWQPSVVVNTILGNPNRLHFLYKSEKSKTLLQNPGESLSHAISTLHKDTENPAIVYPGGYPFWFRRLSAASIPTDMVGAKHISPSLTLSKGHVAGVYLDIDTIGGVSLVFIPYLDGLRDRTIKDHNDWLTIADYLCTTIADAKVVVNNQDYVAGAGAANICANTATGAANAPGPARDRVNNQRSYLKRLNQLPCRIGHILKQIRLSRERSKNHR